MLKFNELGNLCITGETPIMDKEILAVDVTEEDWDYIEGYAAGIKQFCEAFEGCAGCRFNQENSDGSPETCCKIGCPAEWEV